MKVITGRHCGYCFGVKKAIKKIECLIEEKISKDCKEKIFTVGDIIHNKNVIEYYAGKGVSSIKDLNDINPDDYAVIRTHGIPKEDIEELKRKRANLVDGTCPFVLKVQKYARELSKKGYYIILIGERNHPEVKAIKSNIIGNDFIITVDKAEVLKNVPYSKKVAVISQTTQTQKVFNEICGTALLKFSDELLIKNTICKTSFLRQKETKEIAMQADIMIIVGGLNSANTSHLYQLSKKIQPDTYHVESLNDLDKKWFKNKSLAGVFGGASTPQKDITDITNFIKNL